MRGLLLPLLFCSTVFANTSVWADRPFEPPRPAVGTKSLLDDTLRAIATRGGLAEKRPVVLLEVTADWCEPCQQLSREVLETPDWTELVGGDLALRIDFESDEGQDIKRRFSVLGLPTLLVVTADGQELGRVEGYPGRVEWIDAVKGARAGRVGLVALKKAVDAAPSDQRLALELAQARLTSGDTEALVTLDGLFESAFTRGDLDLAAQAGRIKGRWFLRAREDGERARAHFETMARRFVGTRHRGHFLYWQANALIHLKRPDDALALLENWRVEAGPLAVAYQADFMVHHGLKGAVGAAREHHRLEPSAASHHLLSKALHQAGDHEPALEHARAAVALEPGVALYHNHLRALAAP